MSRPAPARALAVLLALVVPLLVASCAGGDGRAAAPPPPWFDPPSGFGPESGRLFEGSRTRLAASDDDLPAALAGETVWAVDDGRLDRVDATGRASTVALPPGRVPGGRPLVEPPEGTAGSAPERVLVAAATVIPGSGTTPPGLAAEVVAVDPATSAVTTVAGTALPWSASPASVRLSVVGTASAPAPGQLPGSTTARRITVLSAATEERRTTLGIDLAAGRVAWTADGVAAAALAGGTVFGVATAPGRTASYTPSAVVGLEAATGVRTATVADAVRGPTVVPAGPALVAVGGRAAATSLFGTGSVSLRFVDPTGRTVRTLDVGAAYAPPRCVWDEADTTVCAGPSSLQAVDADTGAPLWSLPDPRANRVAPALTTAWHGAVYGRTVNGPVVLDARTGADRDPAPGIAPTLVNGRLGVSVDPGSVAGIGGGAALHPATR